MMATQCRRICVPYPCMYISRSCVAPLSNILVDDIYAASINETYGCFIKKFVIDNYRIWYLSTK
ncbi:hypothetical protein RIR_e57724_A0A2N1MKQ7_9GLOM [Rhizophagus irregularis DAOM 181602=DAOM 197198]|nr:hypothetical protein RIR_e57724_A0A2N1MKQ7_9GLOM [Rhizophagus irregularis DAOM 181602=DAOM 197198]